MSEDRGRLVVVDDADALAREAAAELTRIAQRSVAASGRFTLALSGGSTPRRLYALLADPAAPFRAAIPWTATQVFFGDERHVPPDDPQSNYRMADEALLSRVPIPRGNVHRVEAERPDAAEAAALYAGEIGRVFALAPGEWPRFDLILLGMGPDGHTASLFPGTDALAVRHRAAAATWVAKFDAYRITLTLPVFDAAAAVHFLVSGADKAQTLRAVFDPGSPPDAFPCQRIRPRDGDLLWLVDRAAAGELARP
ncbi:MAG TPA: 6-phosphogluconolactonase [Thermoanaerobaculia bacterium]